MFEEYTILDQNEETSFLLDCLATYYDPLKGRQYKLPQNFQKYGEWKTSSHNPSSKTVYNFIRKYTTLVSEEKVIFTLTKSRGVFYRISTKYETEVRKFQQKRDKNNPSTTDTGTDNNTSTNYNKDNTTTNNDTDETQTNPDKQHHQDTTSSLPKVVQNTDTEPTKIHNPTAPTPDMDSIIKEKMISLLPNIQDALMSTITKELDAHTERCITKLKETATKISQTTFNLDLEQESYKRATDKFKNRLFFIDKQLEESTKRIEKHEASVNKQKEDYVTHKCEELFNKMDTTLTHAENDIHATVESIRTTGKNAASEISAHLDASTRHKSTTDSEITTKVDLNTKTIHQMERTIASLTNRIDDVHTDALTAITTQISSSNNEATKQQQALREEFNEKIAAIESHQAPNTTTPTRHHHNDSTSDEYDTDNQSTTSNDENYRYKHRNKHRQHRNRRNRSKRHKNKQREKFVTPTKDHAEKPATQETYQGSTYRKKNRSHDRTGSDNTPNPTYDNTYHQNTYAQYQHTSSQPYRNKTNTIDTYFLRKNIKISCSDDTQLLDFYIRLRIILQQGGIHLIKIEDIDTNRSLQAHLNETSHMTDYDTQSNALFTILCHTNRLCPSTKLHFIPQQIYGWLCSPKSNAKHCASQSDQQSTCITTAIIL